MTQPYGQQPGQQGNFPQAPSYQQGAGGGMPQAPQEYGGPVARPGLTTAGAVLAFVQGGLTVITTAILAIGLASLQDLANKAEQASAGGIDLDGTLGVFWAAVIVQVIGVVLLIWAGVKFMAGTGNALFLVASALQIVLCVFWLVEGATPIVPIALAIMPILSFVFALGSENKRYVQYRATGQAV